MFDLEAFMANVTKELKLMEAHGVTVPPGAYTRAANKDEMSEYVATMSVTDCADLLISLG